MRIVYFGTPPVSGKILEALLDKGFCIVGIVTQPDRPRGRTGNPSPSAVAEVAGDIPLLKPNSCKELAFQEALCALAPDIAVVVAFGQILPRAVLDIPRLGCINVHASLLPKYRGAAPMQRALMAGDRETGVTIMRMVEKMDAGGMLLKKKIALEETTTLGDLEKMVAQAGSEALIETLYHLSEMREEAQEESDVTFAPKIGKTECEINWSQNPREIVNHIRGLSPRPGAYTWIDVGGKKLRLKILRSRLGNEGLSFYGVELLEVQLEGKRAMGADELIRGLGPFKLSLQ